MLLFNASLTVGIQYILWIDQMPNWQYKRTGQVLLFLFLFA